MINRLISFSSGASSSSSRVNSKHSRQSSRPSRPTSVNTPMMRLAFSCVAKGESAGLMTSMAKACVEECGVDSVSDGFLFTFIALFLFFIVGYVV